MFANGLLLWQRRYKFLSIEKFSLKEETCEVCQLVKCETLKHIGVISFKRFMQVPATHTLIYHSLTAGARPCSFKVMMVVYGFLRDLSSVID